MRFFGYFGLLFIKYRTEFFKNFLDICCKLSEFSTNFFSNFHTQRDVCLVQFKKVTVCCDYVTLYHVHQFRASYCINCFRHINADQSSIEFSFTVQANRNLVESAAFLFKVCMLASIYTFTKCCFLFFEVQLVAQVSSKLTLR